MRDYLSQVVITGRLIARYGRKASLSVFDEGLSSNEKGIEVGNLDIHLILAEKISTFPV